MTLPQLILSNTDSPFQAGIVRLQWDWNAPIVYTCALDGTCQLWDARTGRREALWVGHTEEVLDIDLAR